VRSRVEHSVAEQQRPFGIYQTKFRGDPAFLEACQVVTALVEKSIKIRRMQHRTSKGPGPANRPNKASNRVSSPGLGPLRS
jgi:hypothetical protein